MLFTFRLNQKEWEALKRLAEGHPEIRNVSEWIRRAIRDSGICQGIWDDLCDEAGKARGRLPDRWRLIVFPEYVSRDQGNSKRELVRSVRLSEMEHKALRWLAKSVKGIDGNAGEWIRLAIWYLDDHFKRYPYKHYR